MAQHHQTIEQRLKNALQKFLDEVQLVTETGILNSIGNPVFGIQNEKIAWERDSENALIKAINDCFPNVSKKYARNIFGYMLSELFLKRADKIKFNASDYKELLLAVTNTEINEMAHEIAETLNEEITQRRVYIPVDGITILDTETQIKIGQVTICPSGIGPINETIENAKRDFQPLLREHFKKYKAYAFAKDEGDAEYVRFSVLSKVKHALNILRLYIATCNDDIDHFKKILPLERNDPTNLTFLAEEISEQPNRRLHTFEDAPRLRNRKVKKEDYEYWQQIGFNWFVSQVEATNSKENSIPARIQRTLSWYSNAINADSLEQKFLNLAVALETLLGGDRGKDPQVSWGSITEKLAERCAFLLGTNLESRMYIVKSVRDLYGIRSQIVHTGAFVSRENISLLESLFEAAIFSFAKKEFTSEEQLHNWVIEQKYS